MIKNAKDLSQIAQKIFDALMTDYLIRIGSFTYRYDDKLRLVCLDKNGVECESGLDSSIGSLVEMARRMTVPEYMAMVREMETRPIPKF